MTHSTPSPPWPGASSSRGQLADVIVRLFASSWIIPESDDASLVQSVNRILQIEPEEYRWKLRWKRRQKNAAGGDNPLSGMDPEMARNPQPVFKVMREEPVMSVDLPSGKGILLSRKAEIDEALRHPEIFSSNMDAVDLKNKRPMIPLQIDPPDQRKYRKLLDPIFSPRKMTAMDEKVSALVNHLIDQFIDRGEVDFAKEFSVPFPSQVFLTLLGLPPRSSTPS